MTDQPVRCPTSEVTPDGEQHTVVGCGSTNIVQDESEPNIWDCLDCGIWFDPSREGVAPAD